jgi:molybdate transport system substrate-binding protein
MLRRYCRKEWTRTFAVALLLFGWAGPACADEIKVAVASALKEGFSDIARAFEAKSGHKVIATFAGTAPITKMLNDGQVFDLVIIAGENVDQLATAGKLVAGPHPGFAKSGVGLALRNGLPKVDVATPEAVRKALLEAKSLAYSAGPSGLHAANVLKTLGIADEVAGKTRQYPSGVETTNGLKRGEIDLAFALTSEFRDAEAIVDLVSSGSTLKANNLVEVEEIMSISSRLIVNQAALKMKRELLQPVIAAIEAAIR